MTSLFHLVENGANAWDGAMIGCTFAIIIALRFVMVFSINTLTNMCRGHKQHRFPFRDSFLQAYAGLRGPVAFALVFTLPTTVESHVQLVTTTLVVVWAFIWIVGTTAKPIIKCLGVKHSQGLPFPREIYGHTKFSRLLMKIFLRSDYEAERKLADDLVFKRKSEVKLEAVNLRRVAMIERIGSTQLFGSENTPFLSLRNDLALFEEIDNLHLETRSKLLDSDFANMQIEHIRSPTAVELSIFGHALEKAPARDVLEDLEMKQEEFENQ